MIDSKLLMTFATVVELASFEKAASQLYVTQSAISQRIKLLEQQLGQLLLVRSTPIEPTKQGLMVLRYYQQLKIIDYQFEDEFGLRPRHKEKDKLRMKIGINADSLETWFVPVIDALINEQDLLLDFIVQDQSLTHNMLKNGQVMASVSEEPNSLTGCMVQYIGELDYGLICTKDFYKKHFSTGDLSLNAVDVGQWVEIFKSAPTVFYNRDDGLHQKFFMSLLQNKLASDDSGKNHDNNFDGVMDKAHQLAAEISASINPHFIPSVQVYYEFIKKGHGYGIVPLPQFKESQQSALIHVFPKIKFSTKLYWHYWSVNKELMERVYHHILLGMERGHGCGL